MLDYMERKYKEPFTTIEFYAGQDGKDYTMLKVQSCRRKINGILVRAVRNKEGVVYQDNYLAYLLREQIEGRIKALAEPIFGECKIFYKIPEMVFPEDFPADMDVDAFLKHPQSMIKIYFYLKNTSSNKQGQFEQLFHALNRESYVIGGVVSYSANMKMYQMITRENFTGDIYQGYQYHSEAIFSMDEKGSLAYLEWKE